MVLILHVFQNQSASCAEEEAGGTTARSRCPKVPWNILEEEATVLSTIAAAISADAAIGAVLSEMDGIFTLK